MSDTFLEFNTSFVFGDDGFFSTLLASRAY